MPFGAVLQALIVLISHCSHAAFVQMARELFTLTLDQANLTLGALTIVCAITGILGGGELWS